MALKLLKIELKNIRSHSHFIFEPEGEGVTAISGPNGTGKSTIVDSVAWALYGTKPDGVSKAQDIFKSGIGEKDKAYAILDILVDGTHYRIVRKRVNKNGAVECEIFLVKEDASGAELTENVAGPSVSHAEIFLRRNLKMDEKGFLAAILVQQKQVDHLIAARPHERGAVIEKLTGIASLTAALTEARQEYNNLKKVASYSTVNEGELQAFKESRVKLSEQDEALESKLRRGNKRLRELKEQGLEARAKLEDSEAQAERYTEISKELDGLGIRIESKKELFETALDEKVQAKKKLSLIASTINLESAAQEVDSKRRETRELHIKVDRLDRESAAAKSSAKEAGQLMENSPFGSLHQAEEARRLALQSKQEAVEAIAEAESSRSEWAGELKKLKKAVEIISQGDSCPTCLQKVEEVAPAVAALEELQASLVRNIEQAKITVESSREQESISSATVLQVESYSAAHAEELSAKASAKSALREREGVASALKVEESALKKLEKLLGEAQQQESIKLAYDKSLASAQQLSTDVDLLVRREAELKASLKTLSAVAPAKLNKLRAELQELRNKHSSTLNLQTEGKGERKLLQQKIAHLDEKIAKAEEEIAKYKELLKSVEVAGSSVELVGEFREERITKSIPVIEVYASDLLNRFTEGKFTRLKLDKKFNATVTLADGTLRPVGLLSGGELSAASMALRLAISMLLNSGGSENLIILDEVLVSQDINRAELILSTVKEVCKGQVILIAHNDSIDAVADKIVTLTP